MTVIIFQPAPCNILSATLSSNKKRGVITVILIVMGVYDYNKKKPWLMQTAGLCWGGDAVCVSTPNLTPPCH